MQRASGNNITSSDYKKIIEQCDERLSQMHNSMVDRIRYQIGIEMVEAIRKIAEENAKCK